MISRITPTVIDALMDWFERHRRKMPWRGSEDPYHIWVSEMMLQQTQVSTVEKYFDQWIKRFPDVFSLAEATLEDVLKVWEGLGYYTRARNFHKGAKYLAANAESRERPFPETYDEWLKVPGVGPYTAAAVSSIAFAYPAAVLDANVLRVMARFFCLQSDMSSPAIRQTLFKTLSKSFYDFHPGWVNQAWMELGSLQCKIKADCESCPLRTFCCAWKHAKTGEFPVKREKKAIPERYGAIFIIRKQERFLMLKRPAKGFLGGLWEFPGYTLKKSYFDEDYLKDFLRSHRLRISDDSYQNLRHSYTHFHQLMRVYLAVLEGEWRDPQWAAQRWVNAAEARGLPRSGLTLKISKSLPNN